MAHANGPGIVRPRVYQSTQRRDAAKSRVRKWKRHRARWATQPKFHGGRYADLLAAGRARPYELGDLRFALLEVLSRDAVAMLEHVLACERGFGKHTGGVELAHATTAKILRCSARHAGDVMRELCGLGLLEQRPRFRLLTVDERTPRTQLDVLRGSPKHYECASTYVTTARAQELVTYSRRNQVGTNCQPGGSQRPLRGHRKGVPARGRAAQSFVAAVLESRRRSTARPEVARVIERLPDGRVALGSPLNADAVAKRLRTDGVARGRPATVEDAISAAWRAFEERDASR